MSFLFVILSNLWRRPIRSILTTMGVSVGVASGVAMAGISWGFQRSLERVYAARGADVIISRLTDRKPLPTPFDQKRVEDLRSIPGVHDVAGMLWDTLGIEQVPAMPVYGWETGSFLWEHLNLQAGQLPTDTEVDDGVYLGAISAGALDKKVGDTLLIESRTLRVKGIYESEAMIENGSAIMPLPILQSILDSEGKINFINVRLSPDLTENQFETLRQTIQSRFRGLKVFRAGEMAQNSLGIRTAKAMSYATTGIALLIGTLGMMNTLLTSVFERTSDIGLLMAVGWRRRRVMAMILFESLILSIAGAVAGISSAIVGVKIMQKMDFMQGMIEGEFSPRLIVTALVISSGLGILGGVYPAARAAALQPSAALRSA